MTPCFDVLVFKRIDIFSIKVKITDMQVRGAPRTLYPGEPLCAPAPVVVVESVVNLLRLLHSSSFWTSHINAALLER